MQSRQYYIGYVQDEWKIKSNLTLNYGLRYEYYTPLKEANNRQIYFDINTGALRNPSEDPYHTSGNNFGPRIGLTWSPNPNGTGRFGGGKTVIRGGFGIYYGPGQTEDQIQPIESNRISSTLSGGSFPQDPNVIAAAFINNPANRQVSAACLRQRLHNPGKGLSVQRLAATRVALQAGDDRRVCWLSGTESFPAKYCQPHPSRSDNDTRWHDAAEHFRHSQ